MKMKKYIYSLLVVLLTGVVCLQSSCDDHEAIDTNIHVGDIVFADHTTMRYEQFVIDSFAQMSRTPVGVVFAEQTSKHPALAVMLDEPDESQCVFTDSLGFSLGTSTSVDSCAGKNNTAAMYATQLSPLADLMFRYQFGGMSAYVPAVDEMRLLITSLPVVNPIIKDLGGTMVELSGDGWYWTSTETEGNANYQAYVYSANGNTYQPAPKDEQHRCRAIFEINGF